MSFIVRIYMLGGAEGRIDIAFRELHELQSLNRGCVKLIDWLELLASRSNLGCIAKDTTNKRANPHISLIFAKLFEKRLLTLLFFD